MTMPSKSVASGASRQTILNQLAAAFALLKHMVNFPVTSQITVFPASLLERNQVATEVTMTLSLFPNLTKLALCHFLFIKVYHLSKRRAQATERRASGAADSRSDAGAEAISGRLQANVRPCTEPRVRASLCLRNHMDESVTGSTVRPSAS